MGLSGISIFYVPLVGYKIFRLVPPIGENLETYLDWPKAGEKGCFEPAAESSAQRQCQLPVDHHRSSAVHPDHVNTGHLHRQGTRSVRQLPTDR